jgi:nucleotide-binding universal stress UspA family protein
MTQVRNHMNPETDTTAYGSVIARIFHPSDFSAASEVAFAHALKAALITHSVLDMLHVTAGHYVDGADFPGVRETLARWGLLPLNSPPQAVVDLGIDVVKRVTPGADPVHAANVHLERYPAELIVLATHQHQGRARWLRRSVAGQIARQAGEMTLFIPEGVPGFVSWEDGSISLRSVLIPIDAAPDPRPAVAAAARVARMLQCARVTFTLVHVGKEDTLPEVRTSETPGWEWRCVTRPGDPAEVILEMAGEIAADLIVMATAGRHGFLEALQGSTTERIVRQAPCPLLAMPAHLELPWAAWL